MVCPLPAAGRKPHTGFNGPNPAGNFPRPSRPRLIPCFFRERPYGRSSHVTRRRAIQSPPLAFTGLSPLRPRETASRLWERSKRTRQRISPKWQLQRSGKLGKLAGVAVIPPVLAKDLQCLTSPRRMPT